MTTTDMVDPKFLAGVREIAFAFAVSPQAVSSSWPGMTGFPAPVRVLASGPVYDIRQVIEWWQAWVPIKGKKIGTLPDPKAWR